MLKLGKIVALDSTQNFINSISGISIRLRLSPGPMPASIESLISSRSEGYCTLTIKEYSEIEQVLGALRKAELQVLEMKLMQPDLEEVFIKIVGSKSD